MSRKKKLMGPVITIIILTLIIIVVSGLASLFGIQGEITKISNGSLETSMTTVKSVFSSDGLKYLFSFPVKAFKDFEPLVLLIVSLMAISIGKASGLFKAVFIRFRKVKPAVVTFVTLFLGIVSSFIGEYSFVVLIPLMAVIYQYLGKNPIMGVLTSFIGVTLGYGAGIVFNFDDYQLGLLTREAATISVDKDYVFNAWSNSFIMFASALILTVIGTIIIESFLRPKVNEAVIEDEELEISGKGLVLSNIIFVILVAISVYMIIPGLPFSGLLLDMEQKDYVAQLLGGGAPFTDAFIFMLLIIMMACSFVYGFVSNNFKNTNDYSVGLSKEFNNLGYIFVLMFFVALMTGILKWTNLGEVVASQLISFVSGLEFTGIPLIAMMFVIIILMSILIPDSITKWTLAAPIFVPLFMKANITPDFTQFVFKAADSVGKAITPLFIYFIIMLAFLEKYNGKETTRITVFGTMKIMMPTILLFAVVWFAIIIGWFIIGIPIGPDTFPTV